MNYTVEEARQEVGNSTDWKVGLEASMKKWRSKQEGNVAYGDTDHCGLCLVMLNRGGICRDCPLHVVLASDICSRIALGQATAEEVIVELEKLREKLEGR